MVVVDSFVLFFFFPVRRIKRKTPDAQLVLQEEEDNVNVGVEDNVIVGVDTMPKTGNKNTRRGRPRKTKVAEDIDEVIKELLSNFEIIDGEDEDLLYNADEVNKEKARTTNWWDKVNCNISEKRVEVGDQESDDESEGLASLQVSDFDYVGKN